MEKPIKTSSYLQKVVFAIETIAERGGSSYQKIEGFLRKQYPEIDVRHNFVMKALHKGVDEGIIEQDGNSYKLSKKTKAIVKKGGNKTIVPTKKTKKVEKQEEEYSYVLIIVSEKRGEDVTIYKIPAGKISEELDELLEKDPFFEDLIADMGAKDQEEEDDEDSDKKNEDRWKRNQKFFDKYRMDDADKKDVNQHISRIYTLVDRF